MKNIRTGMMALLLAGCVGQNYDENFNFCPRVHIRAEDQAIVQTVGTEGLFKIEMIGYKGRCYYDERVKKDKAVVAPEFKITRLSQTNVEDVHFSYYMETAQGPERFLGRKTYYAHTQMLKDAVEIYHTPKDHELTSPAGEYDFDLYAGLNAIKGDSEYKLK